MANNILEVLINVSEKAANIARSFRQNEHLFSLLVQEKSMDESNPRFVRDYKTLADVLIQETIRHDVGLLVNKIKKNFDLQYFSFFFIFCLINFFKCVTSSIFFSLYIAPILMYFLFFSIIIINHATICIQ